MLDRFGSYLCEEVSFRSVVSTEQSSVVFRFSTISMLFTAWQDSVLQELALELFL